MSEKLSDNVSVDDETGTLTIYGIKYAGELFKALLRAYIPHFESLGPTPNPEDCAKR